MKVKITKCSGKDYWYKNQIGMTLNVENGKVNYGLKGCGNLRIDKSDCEIIPEHKININNVIREIEDYVLKDYYIEIIKRNIKDK